MSKTIPAFFPLHPESVRKTNPQFLDSPAHEENSGSLYDEKLKNSKFDSKLDLTENVESSDKDDNLLSTEAGNDIDSLLNMTKSESSAMEFTGPLEKGTKPAKSSLLSDIADSIMNPGVNDSVTLLMRGSFVGLFCSLTFLLFVTDYSVHVAVLLVTSILLYLSIEYFLKEYDPRVAGERENIASKLEVPASIPQKTVADESPEESLTLEERTSLAN